MEKWAAAPTYGRTIEGIYRIVAHCLNTSVTLPASVTLPSFSQRELFPSLPDEVALSPCPKLKDLPSGPRVLPQEEKVVYSMTSDYLQYSYPEISKYCHTNRVGVQAILMCAYQRGLRKFNNITDETQIVIQAPIDSRKSVFASQEMQRRELLSGSAAVLLFVKGKESVLDEIVECNEKMREAQTTSESAARVTYYSSKIDEKSGELKSQYFSYPSDTPLIGMSNVGCYTHVNNPRLYCVSEFNKLISPIVYSYKDGNILNVLVARSDPMPHDFMSCFYEEADKVFNEIGSKRI
ncbi:hypothetical protein EIN_122850 [Entamoeba invadens IP1]|uniref:O-acyltransferase WSD1 C-terminal domain-containing protein n=1 Tax=Entamoeba invadens IP1 TaxID=370355 RepID=A0A0A1UG46_ENTIV|nr:hypothetical protein EIN_122850 [Entamoeba invadens IP1]ELP92334.1 hypothetical protein EIN_122850 [Entamoeba invadens IP1]|eukprot:XP_004259105.1 hypothetical protein EIN_122850 [Entamoeba invadens IP1]